MATVAIFRPVGKRISCKHFSESMRLIWIAFIVLLLLVPVYGQLTSSDWNDRGLAFDKEGKYDAAINAYDEAIKLNSSDAFVWYNKGASLYGQGKYG